MRAMRTRLLIKFSPESFVTSLFDEKRKTGGLNPSGIPLYDRCDSGGK
jgi:hypothetical protein